MPFRVSFFFSLRQGLKEGGWTVNLYNNATDLSVVQAKTDAMRQLMWVCTGSTVNVFGARIQDLAQFRAAVLQAYGYNTSLVTDANANTDTFNTSALVSLTDNNGRGTKFWFRGLQDDAVTDNGQWRPMGSYKAAWTKMLAAFKDASNLWVQRRLDTQFLRTFVQQITPAGVVTSVGHGLAAGNLVRIGRIQFPKTLNRVFRVAAKIDNDNFTLTGPPAMTGNAIVGASSYAQKQTYLYNAITNAAVLRVSSHKTGRPFGLLIGRRRVVRP